MTLFKTRLTTIAIVVSAITGGIAGCNDSSNDENKNPEITDVFEAKARDLVSKMTADEKLHMIIGPGFGATPINDKVPVAGTVGFVNGVLNEETGLDIPATKLMDGPAGIRISPTRTGDSSTYYATNFPSGVITSYSIHYTKLYDIPSRCEYSA